MSTINRINIEQATENFGELYRCRSWFVGAGHDEAENIFVYLSSKNREFLNMFKGITHYEGYALNFIVIGKGIVDTTKSN